MPGIVAGKRLPELRNALLPGVEGLAIGEPLGGGFRDEGRRRQVAFTGPERDHPLARAAVIDDGDNAAFRGGNGFGTQARDQGHKQVRLMSSECS